MEGIGTRYNVNIFCAANNYVMNNYNKSNFESFSVIILIGLHGMPYAI